MWSRRSKWSIHYGAFCDLRHKVAQTVAGSSQNPFVRSSQACSRLETALAVPYPSHESSQMVSADVSQRLEQNHTAIVFGEKKPCCCCDAARPHSGRLLAALGDK